MGTETLTRPMQTADENPRLEFRDGQFLLKSRNVLGGYIERFISNQAVREAFSGIPTDSGWLRPEVARWGNGKVGEWAVVFIPPGIHEIELQRETLEGAVIDAGPANAGPVSFDIDRINVPLPGLVFFGLQTQYFIWAVKTPKLEPYQEIYRCPLPNIYADGNICWGMVKPQRATARTMFDAFDLFMKSTFNNHLAAGRSKKHREDVRVMLRSLSFELADGPALSITDVKVDGAPHKYPIEDLVRQVDQTGVTLDASIRNYFETGEMPA